jgi:hypothetical protein
MLQSVIRSGQDTRRNGQHGALDDELIDDSARPDTERPSDSKFPLPRCRACEQQTRDVGAGNHQDQSDGRRQYGQSRPRLAYQVVTKSNGARVPAEGRAMIARILACEVSGNQIQPRLRLAQRDAGNASAAARR